MRRDRPPTIELLARRVAANLRRRCGVRRGDRLVVAVSGGADSVALLLLLVDAATEHGLEIEVAHFDHALRDDSATDALWVQDLARSLALTCHVERWSSPRPGEAAARDARYAWLEGVASASAAAAIVTAHHLDDQIETVLLRLGRGVGPRGALGMAWRRSGRVPIVRPLLDVRRSELRDVCAACGVAWREDPTNTARDRARNRVRHDLLPALESALGPQALPHWAATLEDWRGIWRWIDTQAEALVQSAVRDDAASAARTGDIERLRQAPEPVLRAALLRWLDPVQPSRAHIDAAVRLVRRGVSGRTLVLPHGYRLAREQTGIVLLPPEPKLESGPARAPVPGPQSARAAGTWHAEPIDTAAALAAIDADVAAMHDHTHRHPAMPAPPAHAAAHLASDALQPPLELRTPRPGDRVQLLGAPGHRTLARVFQDRRVPARSRASWPVLSDGQGIVWVPGIGVAERARIGPGTSAVLRASYQRDPGSPLPPEGLPEAPPGP